MSLGTSIACYTLCGYVLNTVTLFSYAGRIHYKYFPCYSQRHSKRGGKEARGSDAMDCCSEEDSEDDGEDDSCDDSDSGEEDGQEQGEGEGEEEEDGPEGVKKAAAAMAVGVGNLSDPENCQVIPCVVRSKKQHTLAHVGVPLGKYNR